MASPPPEDGPGRPRSPHSRSPHSREAILDATRELIHESRLAAISGNQIAARARSSTATIYRSWPDEAALALDAFLDTSQPIVGLRDTGDLIADLTAEMPALVTFLTTSPNGSPPPTHRRSPTQPRTRQTTRRALLHPGHAATTPRLTTTSIIGGAFYKRLLVSGQPILAQPVISFLAPDLTPPTTDDRG